MCGFIMDKYLTDLGPKAIDLVKHRGTTPPVSVLRNEWVMTHATMPMRTPEFVRQPIDTEKHGTYMFVGEIFRDHCFDPTYDTENLKDTIEEKLLEDSDLGLVYNLRNILGTADGFWAIAGTDQDGTPFAFTDHLGLKPVYYRRNSYDGNIMDIANEPQAIAKLRPDLVTMDHVYFSNVMKWGYSPDDRTPWNEIKKLPPGHYVYGDHIRSYFNWGWFRSEIARRYMVGGHSSFYKLMDDVVRRWARGFRVGGLLLSGGLDSSIIHHHLSRNGIDCYSLHARNGLEDEFEYAKLIEPQVDILDTSKYLVSTEEQVEIMGDPVDLGSVEVQCQLAAALRDYKAIVEDDEDAEPIHLCFTGDGADEFFGGYNRAQDYDSQMSDGFVEIPNYHAPRLDRAMMKEQIEVRSPFLSPYIVAFATMLPYAARQDKQYLRDVYRHILPTEVVCRPKQPLKTKKHVENTPWQLRHYRQKIWEGIFNGPNS